MKYGILASALALGVGTAASADIEARFLEGAPKDRFVLSNTGDCGVTDLKIELDLSSSTAGLIFDITGAGAGVEVFQPFELVRGADLVASNPVVTDGMNAVTLDVPRFPAGAEIAFTVDVDDTADQSDLGQIRVSGSEIAGAAIRVGLAEAAFSADGRAVLQQAGCNA